MVKLSEASGEGTLEVEGFVDVEGSCSWLSCPGGGGVSPVES